LSTKEYFSHYGANSYLDTPANMSTTSELTTIKVQKSTRENLFQLKQSSTETYDAVIQSLIEGER